MLKEQQNVSQHAGEPVRRWFYSPAMDLIVWLDDEGQPAGFQLSYELSSIERKILTWLPGRGYAHETLDEGEDRPFRYKMAPVMVPDGVFERDAILLRFQKEAREIDPGIFNYIKKKLSQYPS
jgi:hypothetical protein